MGALVLWMSSLVGQMGELFPEIRPLFGEMGGYFLNQVAVRADGGASS